MQTRRSLSQKNILPQALKVSKTSIKIKYEEENKETTLLSHIALPVKSKSLMKPRIPWKPKNWEAMWGLIKEMREENPAAVDTMGAHCISNPESSLNE